MPQNVDKDLAKARTASAKAYSSGSKKFFDFFTPDVTVYSVNSTEPVIGLPAFKKEFSLQKREFKVLKDNVKMLGDEQALVVLTARIKQSGITFNVRQSGYWTKTQQGWQIKHLHTTLLGKPTPPVATSPKAITVMTEKIATVAAVVGVAQ